MNKKKRLLFALVAIVIIAMAILYKIGMLNGIGKIKFDVESLRNYLLSFGSLSVVALIFVYAIKPLLVFAPVSVIAIVSGLLYGPVYGTIITMFGCFLAASTGFYIARWIGSGVATKLMRGRAAEIEGDIEQRGFSIMLLMRLAIIFPYDLLSYAAGLTKMRFRDFILGTMIGVAPEMVAYNFIGTSITDIFSQKTLYAVAIVLTIALGTFIIKIKKPKLKKENID